MGEYNLELLSTLWEGREAGIRLLKEAFTILLSFPIFCETKNSYLVPIPYFLIGRRNGNEF